MNKDRRKRIEAVCEQLRPIMEELDSLNTEEQEAYDNLPDGIQSSEKGSLMEGAATTLDESMQTVEDLINTLSELTGD